METPRRDSGTPTDVSEVVRDFEGKPFQIDAEVGHSDEVKIEWVEKPQNEAYVLLTSAEARELAAKLRQAIGLPIGAHFFRESVFDAREGIVELSVVARGYSSVFIALVDGCSTGTFKHLGQFLKDEAMELATVLEAAASAVDRAS